jgi:hypothetical protein
MIVMAVAPAAADDWIDTDGTTPVTVSVLANDTPSPGASLLPSTLTVVSAPQHGTARVNTALGQITYTANSGFVGTDSLLYTVRDSLGGTSNPAMLSVRVNRPVAADDWTDTDGTTPVNIAVLANDTDPDGNQHIDPTAHTGAFVTKVSNPQHGTAVLNADGSFTYTAAANFTGTDSFRYTVTDDNGGTSLPATVFVRVNVPTAADDLASFSGTTPTVIDVLANDQDPDGNNHLVPSSVTVVTSPLHGTVTAGPSPGQLTYTAKAGFLGSDTFRYTVSDDNGATSAPGTVTVVGSPAVGAGADFTDTDGTTPVAVPVLANDSAPGGAALVRGSVIVSTAPKHGTVTVNPTTGDITYTAAANFAGTDTFQYTVAYGSGVIVTPAKVVGGKIVSPKKVTLAKGAKGAILSPAQVSVRVNRPVAADDWTDTDGTTPVDIAVLANDTDPDGNQHIDPTAHTGAFVSRVSSPLHGTATLNADGSFTYTAAAGFTGTDSFRYTVTDDNGGTSLPATVFVRVNVPTAADDFGQAAGTTPVTINVLENDTDPDGNDHLVLSSVIVVSKPQHGSVSVDPTTGQVTYTAFAGWSGPDSFRYTVSDDNGATSAPGTVRVNTSLPIAPGGFGVTGSQGISFPVLASAGDPFGTAALTNAVVAVASAPQNGQATIDAKTHQITYVPNAGFTGVDSFSYTITDANGAKSLPAILTVRVLPPAPASLLAIQEQFYITQYVTSLNGTNKHPVGL